MQDIALKIWQSEIERLIWGLRDFVMWDYAAN
jgi:hypothetical protein